MRPLRALKPRATARADGIRSYLLLHERKGPAGSMLLCIGSDPGPSRHKPKGTIPVFRDLWVGAQVSGWSTELRTQPGNPETEPASNKDKKIAGVSGMITEWLSLLSCPEIRQEVCARARDASRRPAAGPE